MKKINFIAILKKKQIIILIFFGPAFLYAAFENIEVGAQPLALGNACTALVESPFALYYNPANIHHISSFQFAFSYQNYYGIPEINQLNLIANGHIKEWPLSLGVNRFGNNLYQELQLTIGSSYKLINQASIGLSIQYYYLQITNYGQSSTWGVNLGFQYNLVKNLDMGIQVSNINQPVLGKAKEKLPQCFSMGFCYRPLSTLSLLMEFFRDVSFDQDYRAGIEYNLSKNFVLRMGIIDQYNTYNLGFGIILKNLVIGYALLNHQVLGVSHVISMLIDL
jgi:hypothetical protein